MRLNAVILILSRSGSTEIPPSKPKGWLHLQWVPTYIGEQLRSRGDSNHTWQVAKVQRLHPHPNQHTSHFFIASSLSLQNLRTPKTTTPDETNK